MLMAVWLQGLGKTITAAALILKTQGLLPAASRGTTWIAAEPQGGASSGRALRATPRGYWLLSDSAASSAATLQAARSGGAAGRAAGGAGMRRTRSSAAALAAPAAAAASAPGGSGSQEQDGAACLGLPAGAQPLAGKEAEEQQEPLAKRPRSGCASVDEAGPASGAQQAAPMYLHPSCSAPAALSTAEVEGGAEGSVGLGTAPGGNDESEGSAGQPEGGILWVECHLCNKWRKVPHGYPVSLASRGGDQCCRRCFAPHTHWWPAASPAPANYCRCWGGLGCWGPLQRWCRSWATL
jgi:hypothetical protein